MLESRFLVAALRHSLRRTESGKLASWPQGALATELIRNLLPFALRNRGAGDCGVYSVLQATQKGCWPAALYSTPDRVGMLRLWAFNMLTLLKGEKWESGWYKDKLLFLADTVLDGNDARRSTLTRGEDTNEAFFFAVANLLNLNIIILRTNMSQPDQAISLFSPLQAETEVRETVVILHQVSGGTGHYVAVAISQEDASTLHCFVRMALMHIAERVSEMGVEGEVEEEEVSGADMWLGSVWGVEANVNTELDSVGMQERWKRLFPDDMGPFLQHFDLEGMKGSVLARHEIGAHSHELQPSVPEDE